MNLREEYLKYRTRRQFFRDCGVGVGVLGLGSLLNERLFADAAPAPLDDPLAPKKPHFAAKAKSIIYLHMAGAPSTLDLFDYKPKLQELNGQPCPDSYIKGQQFAFIKGKPKLLGTPHKFAKYGQSRQEMSEIIPAPADGGRRAVHRPVDVHRAVQPRPGPAVRPHRLAAPRPARHGRVAVLRTRHREPQPAELRASSSPARRRRTAGRRCGAAPFCRPSTRASSCGRRASRCCSCPTPTAWTRPAAGSRSTRSRPSTSSRLDAVGDPEIAHAHRAVRAGLPDADQRAGGDGHLEGDERDPRNVRRQAGPEGVRQQLPAGPAAGRERRALRAAVPLGLGQPRRVEGQRSAATAWSSAARRRTRPIAALIKDLKQRGLLERHAGRLGRRVRPDADERGAQRLEVAGPRPPPAHVHDLDGRRRRRSPATPTARPTSWAITSPKTASTSTTCRPPSCT